MTPAQLLQQTSSCITQLGQLQQEVKHLQHQLLQAGAKDKTGGADRVGKSGTGANYKWLWVVGAALTVGGLGLVASWKK